jgi:hypothetical protein
MSERRVYGEIKEGGKGGKERGKGKGERKGRDTTRHDTTRHDTTRHDTTRQEGKRVHGEKKGEKERRKKERREERTKWKLQAGRQGREGVQERKEVVMRLMMAVCVATFM